MVMRQAPPSPSPSPAGVAPSESVVPARPASARASARQRRRLTRLLTGAAPLLLFLLIAVFGPIVRPYDSVSVRTGERLKPPMDVLRDGSTAVLGTDQVGRDLLA